MKYLSIAIFCLALVSARAQQQQQQTWNRQMQLHSCSIDIKANEFTATTVVEMEFYNPNNQELEGLHHFKLQPGQVITAFQLMLNGQYRKGTIEEKWKATNAYNRIVGKRIDPALLTMEYPDFYSLRIYPVPAKNSRKIKFRIEQLLTINKGQIEYQLPLNIPDTVRDMKISISSSVKNIIPLARPGLIAGRLFKREGGLYLLNYYVANLVARTPVAFSIELRQETQFCVNEQKQFAIRFFPGTDMAPKIHPKRLTVFWDASAINNGRDIEKEINFLQQYILRFNLEKISIIPFNYQLMDTAVFYPGKDAAEAIRRYLKGLRNNGPVQLGAIGMQKNKDELYLLFSDGKNTYGKTMPATNGSLVMCVTSSGLIDTKCLSDIAGTGGGKLINLANVPIPRALIEAGYAESWLMEVRSSGEKLNIEQDLPAKLHASMIISGKATEALQGIQFGIGNSYTGIVKTLNVSSYDNGYTGNFAGRIAMLQQFENIVSSHEWEKILDFGIHEKVVTPNTAYIVLERVEDYIRYNIEAPEELKAECEQLRYVKSNTRTLRDKMREQDYTAALQAVVNLYNSRMTKARNDAAIISLDHTEMDKKGKTEISVAASQVSTRVTNDLAGSSPSLFQKSSSLNEVMVTAYGLTNKQAVTGSVSTVRSNDFMGAMNVEQALQGKVAGLHVREHSFHPGSADKVLLRGTTSIRGGQQPLFVLDGVPISGDINSFLNINDIQDITVLKDAQAAGLYGSGASGGAIVIRSKTGRNYGYYQPGRYKLKDMEDVEYVQAIKSVPMSQKKYLYEKLEKDHRYEAGFYFDMAEHFYEVGLKKDAFEILLNAAEVNQGTVQVQQAIAYMLETWKMFGEAINIYNGLLAKNKNNLALYRNLAWAHYQAGNYQQAVDKLYAAITQQPDAAAGNQASEKASMLYEMNQIIEARRYQLDLSAIPASLIKSVRAEFRIALDGNNYGIGSMKVMGPGKTKTEKFNSINGRPVNFYAVYDHENGYNTAMIYEDKTPMPGKYKVLVDYYGNPYRHVVPSFIKLTTFKNFGKVNEVIEVQLINMDNQRGKIEIASLKIP